MLLGMTSASQLRFESRVPPTNLFDPPHLLVYPHLITDVDGFFHLQRQPTHNVAKGVLQ